MQHRQSGRIGKMNRTQHIVDESHGVRFGRTLIVPVAGDILDQQVQAIVCAANRRGVMGAGLTGQIRMAGGIDIEREAMAQAPLSIGSAISTSSGALVSKGITTIIHAVVSDALGAPTRIDIVRNATSAALQEADRQRVKSVLLPTLGSGLGPGRLPTGTVTVAMIEETIAHLRRFTCRMDRILLAQRDEREASDILHTLFEARALWWGLKV